MRNDLIETEKIEKYLWHQLSDEDKLHFENNMIIDPSFADQVEMQKYVHRLICIYSRRQQRNKLECIYQQLLQETSFAQRLKTIFT